MYSFTILKKAYKIPSTARELTLGQFMDISKLSTADSWGLLNILVGEIVSTAQSITEIEQFKKEITGVFGLIELLNEDIERCLSSGILLVQPKKINILGLDVEIKPNFINQLPYWGYVHTKMAITERADRQRNKDFNATDLIPGILAHNLYCLVTRSRYDEVKAEEFQDQVIKEVGFIEAMQLGNFFLIQQKRLWTSRRQRWTMNLTIWRFRLAYRFSINTARLMFWKRLQVETY